MRSEVEGVIKEVVFAVLDHECTSRIKQQLRRDILDFTKPAKYLSTILATTNLADLNKPAYLDATLSAIAELPGE